MVHFMLSIFDYGKKKKITPPKFTSFLPLSGCVVSSYVRTVDVEVPGITVLNPSDFVPSGGRLVMPRDIFGFHNGKWGNTLLASCG